MKLLPRLRLALVLFPLSLAFSVLLSTSAFGQVIVTPPVLGQVIVTPPVPVVTAASISLATIIIALLGIVVGYLTQSINSGSFFGIVTIPKPVLPYLGLLGGFLGAFTTSITSATLKDEAAWVTALFAGLIGLGGVVSGVTAKQHIDAHLRGNTPTGGAAMRVDAVNKAANDATTKPPAALRTVYRVNPTASSTRLSLSRWVTRAAFATVVLVVSMISTAATVEGCANGAPTPQTQAQIAASEALGVCVESAYVADASKTPPPAALQIALDIATTCGAEAIDVVGAFTTPAASAAAASSVPSRADVATAAQGNAPSLHVAVMVYHQKLGH
jgi:hypothetical protein